MGLLDFLLANLLRGFQIVTMFESCCYIRLLVHFLHSLFDKFSIGSLMNHHYDIFTCFLETTESPIYAPSSNAIPQFWYNTVPSYNYPIASPVHQHALENDVLKKSFDGEPVKSLLPQEQQFSCFNGIGGPGLVKFDYALSECYT